MDNGVRVNDFGLTETAFLKQYEPGEYERPSVTTDILLFTIDAIKAQNYKKNDEKVLKILMIKRKNHPSIGCWAVPGGFVDMDEDLETAALRELKEETGVDNVYIEQLYTFGDVARDPRMRVISTAYMALVDKNRLTVKAGDDASEAAWFEIRQESIGIPNITEEGQNVTKIRRVRIKLINDDMGVTVYADLEITEKLNGFNLQTDIKVLDSCDVAFDHGKVLFLGLERLKNKVEYTQIAFNLMPERFTLTELQQVYQILLDKVEKPAGFRRKIKDMVVETEETRKSRGHRPAKLFTYNKYWGLR